MKQLFLYNPMFLMDGFPKENSEVFQVEKEEISMSLDC